MSTVLKSLEGFQGTAINTVIIGGTAAIEALINVAVYSCPCVEATELTSCVRFSNGTLKSPCTPALLNFYYGLSYLIAPALLLYFISLAANPRLWKLWTGCLKEEGEKKARKSIYTLLTIFITALKSPIAWVCFGLLDGKYYACAVTALPYDLRDTAEPKSCLSVSCISLT